MDAVSPCPADVGDAKRAPVREVDAERLWYSAGLEAVGEGNMETATQRTESWRDFFATWGKAVQARGYPNERTRKDVDFLVSSLALSEGTRVLDIPCGIGRHSVELVKRGYEVTGIDFNGSALSIARRSASEAGVAPRFVEMDMRQLDESELYDAAFYFYSRFGYFEDDENLDVASRIARSLKPGGRFLVDTHVTESIFPVLNQRGWSWSDDTRTVRVLEDAAWNLQLGRLDSEWTFVHRDGSVDTARTSLRLYSYKELCELLEAAGFREFRGFASGSDRPFVLGSPRLSLIARK